MINLNLIINNCESKVILYNLKAKPEKWKKIIENKPRN